MGNKVTNQELMDFESKFVDTADNDEMSREFYSLRHRLRLYGYSEEEDKEE